MIVGQHAKTKSSSTTRAETKSIDHHTQNKLFSARTLTKSISISTLKINPVSIHKLKNKYFSARTQKRPPHKKESVKFDPDAKTKSISTPHQKKVKFDPITEIKSILIPTLI